MDLSADSLDRESELDLLREEVKKKDLIINDKSQIIDSLRLQVRELAEDNEALEIDQQVKRQQIDRFSKELKEKDEEIDALAHAQKELESACDRLGQDVEAKDAQLQKLAKELIKAKKELNEAQQLNEELKHRNETLSTELEMANSKSRRLMLKQRQEEEQPIEYKPRTDNFSSALRFPIADEIGEFMDLSSQLSTTPRACRYHNRQAKAQATITKEEQPLEKRVKQERFEVCPEPEPKRVAMAPVPVPVAPPQRRQLTAEEEHAMRITRAQELARRNAKTKPLHQTSYALELDTFDVTNFNEAEIKRGNIRPPQRPPPEPPVGTPRSRTRRALANCSNTPPVVRPRPVYKKAEAFIV